MKEYSKDQRWVIVFLIYADFTDPKNGGIISRGFLKDLESLCSDLLYCKIDSRRFSVYAAISRVSYEQRDEESGKFIPTSETFIFEVKDQIRGMNSLQIIDAPDNGMHDQKGIKVIFDSIQANEKIHGSSLRWFVNTWDHGSAFGMFTNMEALQRMQNWNFVMRNRRYPAIGRFMHKIMQGKQQSGREIRPLLQQRESYYLRGMSFSFVDTADINESEIFEPLIIFGEPENANGQSRPFIKYKTKDGEVVESGINIFNEILENRELSKGIKASIQDGVDVLMMMNCWMMNLDTISLLTGATEYLIAPQSGIEKGVYNYPAILDYVFHHTRHSSGLQPLDLAKFCIKSITLHSARRTDVRQTVEECAVFAFHLTPAYGPQDEIMALINQFFKIILDTHQTATVEEQQRLALFLKLAAIYSFHFDDAQSLFHIDFLHWIKNLKFSSIPGGTVLEISVLQDLEKAIGNPDIKESLLARLNITKPHIGTNWSDSGRGFVKDYPPSGLCIYLPSKPLDRKQRDRIEKYFKVVPSAEKGFYNGNENLKQLIKMISP